jgi:hypothetical protein
VGTIFWIKRFLTVSVGTFVIVCIAQMRKGHDLSYATIQGAIWGIITAAVFTVTRFFQSRRGQHCAICKDTPEMQQTGHGRDA